MQDAPIQILEVRAGGSEGSVAITVEITTEASRAIHTALAEQLDRRRAEPIESADDLTAVREQAALVERFAPLASAGAHAVAAFTAGELRACLLALTAYADRVDGEHFQPPELRERLAVLALAVTALWDANAAAASAETSEPLSYLRD